MRKRKNMNRDDVIYDLISKMDDNFSVVNLTDEELIIFLEECQRKKYFYLTCDDKIIPSDDGTVRLSTNNLNYA